MKKKLNVGIIFGGRSGEHEVSLQSARSVYEALDKKKYNVVLVGIDKAGRWRLGAPARYLLHADDPKLIKLNTASPRVTAIAEGGTTALINQTTGGETATADVFFPVTHGTFGEDGCLQGLLELLGAAYVGAGVLGSAAGMDKDIMKRLLRDADIPVARFFAVTKDTLTPRFTTKAVRKLGFPIFVKPANLGSSVGISKATNGGELRRAIAAAFRYDTKILLEEYVRGREIECAVLGNDKPTASLPGEVKPMHDFYSYEAKYIDERGAALEIPARISPTHTAAVQKLAVEVFKTLECSGMARVDFFLTPRGNIVVNEINTLPGFTRISMYPKLWEASAVPYPKLLDRLIELALEKKKQKDGLKRSYT